MTRVVGIYTRISQADPDTQTATLRQEAACRQFANARGWPVVEVFEDVDISAYSGAARPAFERMIDAIESGSVSGTVVWKLDRLVRRPKDFERFWDVCERRNAVLASVTEPLDSSTDLGVALVRMLVVMATFESATRGARVRALFEEVARRGDAPLGGERPWGLTEHWRSLDDGEAALLREAAHRLIGGEPLHLIAKDWAARGIAARNGTPWTGSKLRSTIIRPRIAGFRVSNGVVIGKGNFPAVLDEATYKRLCAVLKKTPSRPRARPSHHPPCLLTRSLRCAECGARFGVSWTERESGWSARYVCGARRHVCGSVSLPTEPFDAWVAQQVFGYLDAVRLKRLLSAERRELERQEPPSLVALRQDLGQLTDDHYRRRILTPRRYGSVRRSLCARIDRERSILGLETRFPRLRELAGRGAQLHAQWDTMDASLRADVITAALRRIDLAPTPRQPRSAFDAEHVTLHWSVW